MSGYSKRDAATARELRDLLTAEYGHCDATDEQLLEIAAVLNPLQDNLAKALSDVFAKHTLPVAGPFMASGHARKPKETS